MTVFKGWEATFQKKVKMKDYNLMELTVCRFLEWFYHKEMICSEKKEYKQLLDRFVRY